MPHPFDTDADFIADALADGLQGGAAVDGVGGSHCHDAGEDITAPQVCEDTDRACYGGSAASLAQS